MDESLVQKAVTDATASLSTKDAIRHARGQKARRLGKKAGIRASP